MNTTLVIKNDGDNFERMYYQAICMGEIKDAERLYEQYLRNPVRTFWRDAFRARDINQTTLMSAVINLLGMPFGSYVFKRLDDSVIEIEPWLYSDEGNRQALIDALHAETADPDTLRAFSRSLALTADFLSWLKNYRNTTEG